MKVVRGLLFVGHSFALRFLKDSVLQSIYAFYIEEKINWSLDGHLK